jgi:ribosomal protein S18 acetylase RimI-like enzyme
MCWARFSAEEFTMPEISTNTAGVKAVSLREKYIDGILELMNKEGWYYYDHRELIRYLAVNQDCFALLKNDRVIGSLFTTHYGNQAWIGNIVVAQEARGMGLAARMITGVIDHLRETRHVPTFRLGSVPLAIGLYKKVGFHAEVFTTAQEAGLPLELAPEKIDPAGNTTVERLHAADLETVAAIDERYFKSNRLPLLKQLYRDSIKESCFCLKDRKTIVGFLMVRRRLASKEEAGFAQGPDHAYRLGPSCVLPAYGINGFKALFQESIRAVNEEVRGREGSAVICAVFPKNADKQAIYKDTKALATAMGIDAMGNLDRVFNEHDHLFGAPKSKKNAEQWAYMERLGFHQEYFEQVMSYTPGEPVNTPPTQRQATKTSADQEGIFASATPGDKA